MLLDLDLPDMDGMQVLADIRTKGMQVPVLLLSARGDTQTIVEGLDGGADDFLVRPFAFPELLARLRLILRKQVNVRENVYRCDGLEVDTSNRAVFRDGEEIQLSPREYAILEYLIRNQGIVMTRQQIMDNIYNVNDDVSSNVVDVYIRLLRKKIDARYENKLIHTIRGMGYVVKNNK
jgi:DNA-binding response OmpR family regulator